MWCGGRVESVGVGVDTCSSVDHLLKFCDVALYIGIEPKGFAIEEHNFSEDANAVLIGILTGHIVERG